MKWFRHFYKLIVVAAVAAAMAPPSLHACAACGSANSNMAASPLTNGMNLGILTLMGVIVSVLACAGVFFVRIIRKEEAMTKATAATKQPA